MEEIFCVIERLCGAENYGKNRPTKIKEIYYQSLYINPVCRRVNHFLINSFFNNSRLSSMEVNAFVKFSVNLLSL